MAFKNIVFPKRIGFRSNARYTFADDDARAVSGKTTVTSYWSQHLRQWDVATAIKTSEDFEEFIDFWIVTRGKEDTFLFQDPWDFKSCTPTNDPDDEDQNLGTATASQTDFQLIKTRTYGGESRSYDIYRPDDATVLVAVDGTPQTVTTDYTIESGGIIRFVTPMTGGEVVTAGYEYLLLARFGASAFPFRSPNKQSNGSFFLQGELPVVEERE